jgi:hypothetical protein
MSRVNVSVRSASKDPVIGGRDDWHQDFVAILAPARSVPTIPTRSLVTGGR